MGEFEVKLVYFFFFVCDSIIFDEFKFFSFFLRYFSWKWFCIDFCWEVFEDDDDIVNFCWVNFNVVCNGRCCCVFGSDVGISVVVEV